MSIAVHKIGFKKFAQRTGLIAEDQIERAFEVFMECLRESAPPNQKVSVYIPQRRPPSDSERAMVAQYLERGYSIRETIKQTGISEHYVREIGADFSQK